MLNGLIREVAKVKSYQNNVSNLKVSYRLNLDDSVAVNGTYLSVTKLHSDDFELELPHENRKHIVVRNLKNKVYIESALRYGDRIDGHLMQGHIDFINRFEKIEEDENGVGFYIALPREAMKFMVRKGSIGTDGVSLTINEIIENGVRPTIMPITFKETLFKEYEIGREINIENDLFARYIYVQMQDKDKGLSRREVERIAYLY